MEYQICNKTVLDTSYPGITFDLNGICNHYYDFIENVKPNWEINQNGEKKIEQIINKIKGSKSNSDFNCLLGLSGGLDSSYMLHKVVKEFKLKPLVFHVDGGWNSETSTNNINNLIEKLDLDLFTEVIDWEEMRDFQLAFFKSGVPHIDIPQDHAFISVLYNFATKYNIKYILNGGNISTEAVIMPYKYYYWGTDLVHINDIIKNFGTIHMKSYPFSSVFRHKLYLRYFKGLKVIKPLNYLNFRKNEAIKLLEEEYGWKDYSQKHFESRFTKFYEGYWLPKKFGFDVRRCQLSSLILTGQISRDEALSTLLNSPYDEETIHHDIEYIANKLNIPVSELTYYQKMPNKFYNDYKNNHLILSLAERASKLLNLGRRGGAF